MKKSLISGIIVVMVAVLLLAACSSNSPEVTATEKATPAENVMPTKEATTGGGEAAVEKEPITIGLYAPLTGPVAFLGQGFDLGITLAIEDLGGAIDGHPIEYIPADDKCNPTDAVNAVNKLIDVDKVDAMIGGGCSSATVGALPIIAEGETPSVSATSTNPGIYNEIGVGGNEWGFRINPDDLIMAGGFAEFIQEQGTNSISLVAENTDFGRGAIGAYKPVFDALGVTILSEDYFDLGTADFRPALARIKSEGADSALLVFTENDCANFMRQFREVGVEAAVFSRGACNSPLFLELTADDPNIAEGIIEFAFFTKDQDPDLADRFEKRFDTPLTGHRMGGYYAMYYTLAPAIRAVINSGQEITRETIRAALEELSQETPAGLIQFDNHNQAYTNGVLTVIKDGQRVVLQVLELSPADHTLIE